MAEPNKSVIPYAEPGTQRRPKSRSKTVAAPVSFIFLAIAGASALMLSNEWLFYGQDRVEMFVTATIPVSLLLATILAIIAMGASSHPSGLIALVACIGGWILLAAFIAYGIANLKIG